MRMLIPIMGIALVVIGLIVSFFVISPVSQIETLNTDFDNDGTNDSQYSVLTTFLNDGQIVNEKPFSLTFQGSVVTDIKIDVTWSVSWDPPDAIDTSTLQIDCSVKFEYWTGGNAPTWALIDEFPFTSTEQDGTWTTDYALSSLLTSENVVEGTPADVPPWWEMKLTVSIHASAYSAVDSTQHEDSATPLEARYVVNEDTMPDDGPDPHPEKVSFILNSSGTGVVMDALGGGLSFTNPAFVLLVIGIIFLPIGFCLGRKG